MREEAAVGSCTPTSGRWDLTVGDEQLCVDQIWLATGSRPDIGADPALAQLAERHVAQVVDGMPVLDESLALPGTRVHLSGVLAALHLGPTAAIVFGHRRAAARIAPAVIDALAGRI